MFKPEAYTIQMLCFFNQFLNLVQLHPDERPPLEKSHKTGYYFSEAI